MTVAEGRPTPRETPVHSRAHHRDRLLRTRDGHRAAEAGRGLPDLEKADEVGGTWRDNTCGSGL